MLDTTDVSDTEDQHAQLSDTDRPVGRITADALLAILNSTPPSRRGSNASQRPNMEHATVYRTLELNLPHLQWSLGGKHPSEQGQAQKYYVRRLSDDENEADAPPSSAIEALLRVPGSNPNSRRVSVSSADSPASRPSSQSSNHSGSSGGRPHRSSRIEKKQTTKAQERSVSARRAARIQHAAARGDSINVSFDPCLTWDQPQRNQSQRDQSQRETTCSKYLINIKVETTDLDAAVALGDHFATVTERVFEDLIKTQSTAEPILSEGEIRQALRSVGNVFAHLDSVLALPHPDPEQVAEDFAMNRQAAEDALWTICTNTDLTVRKSVEALRTKLNSDTKYDKVSVTYALPTYTVSTPRWPRESDNPTFKFGPSAALRQLRKDQIKHILQGSLNQPRGEGGLVADISHGYSVQLHQRFDKLNIAPQDDTE